jgi:hypothetical protein
MLFIGRLQAEQNLRANKPRGDSAQKTGQKQKGRPGFIRDAPGDCIS